MIASPDDRSLEPVALDAAPAAIAAPRPLQLEVDDRPVPLLRIAPIGDPSAEPQLTAVLDSLAPPGAPGLSTTDGLPLIGFLDEDAPAAATAAMPLVRDVVLTRERPTAVLALDPRGLRRDPNAEIDDAALEEVLALLRQDAPFPVIAPFGLRQLGGGLGGPLLRAHEARFALAREPWRGDGVRIDLRSLGDRRALERLDPASDARAELLATYPTLGEDGSSHDLAEIIVSARGVSPIARPFAAELRVETPDPRFERALSVAFGQDPDAVAEARLPSRVWLAPTPFGQVRATRRVQLLCGPDGAPEPETVREEPLRVALSGPEGVARSAEHLVRIAPPAGPVALEISVVDGAERRRATLPRGADLGSSEAPLVSVSETTLVDGGALAPRRATLLTVEMTLFGRLTPGLGVQAAVIPEVIGPDGAPVDALSDLLRVAYAQRAGASETRAALGPNARFARAVIAAPTDPQVYAAALGALSDRDRPMTLRARLQIRGGFEDAIEIRRPFRIAQDRAVDGVGVDFGAGAVAIAAADGAGAATLVRLGAALAGVNPRAAAGPFLDSAIDLDPAECWRADAAPETLWSALPGATLRVDPKEAAHALGRTYAVSAPPARVRAAAPAVLHSATAELTAVGGAARFSQRIWSTAEGRGARFGEASVEAALRDGLHELADLHLAATGQLHELAGARLAVTHPSAYTAGQVARLRQAADRFAHRLGVSVDDPETVRLVSNADAVAAHALERLPVDDRPHTRALVFDLGARWLDLALVEADRAAPGVGAGLRAMQTRRRGGAALGGDAIDLVLYFTIHAALRRLRDDGGLVYAHDLCAPISPDARDPQSRAHRAAKRRLAHAISAAKQALSAACRDVAERRGSAYGWPRAIPLEVQIGESGGGADAWPARERIGVGAGRPGDQSRRLSDGVEIAHGATIVKRDGGLFMRLTREAVNRPAMAALMSVLCARAPMAMMGDAPPADHLILAGRGALWPLVYERLAVEITRGKLARRFAFPRPHDADGMKASVALGAAILAARPDDGPSDDAPRHYALLSSEVDMRGVEMARRLAPESAFDAIDGYAGRLRLVEAPRGLTADELNADPWTRALVMETGLGGDARTLGLDRASPPPLFQRSGDGLLSLRIGDAALSTDETRLDRPAALHPATFDVTEEFAPPGYPGSVELDELTSNA